MSGLCAGPACDAAVRVVRGRARQSPTGPGRACRWQGLQNDSRISAVAEGNGPFRPPKLLCFGRIQDRALSTPRLPRRYRYKVLLYKTPICESHFLTLESGVQTVGSAQLAVPRTSVPQVETDRRAREHRVDDRPEGQMASRQVARLSPFLPLLWS